MSLGAPNSARDSTQTNDTVRHEKLLRVLEVAFQDGAELHPEVITPQTQSFRESYDLLSARGPYDEETRSTASTMFTAH